MSGGSPRSGAYSCSSFLRPLHTTRSAHLFMKYPCLAWHGRSRRCLKWVNETCYLFDAPSVSITRTLASSQTLGSGRIIQTTNGGLLYYLRVMCSL